MDGRITIKWLSKVGFEGCVVVLGQLRYDWRDFVNTVMKLQVP